MKNKSKVLLAAVLCFLMMIASVPAYADKAESITGEKISVNLLEKLEIEEISYPCTLVGQIEIKESGHEAKTEEINLEVKKYEEASIEIEIEDLKTEHDIALTIDLNLYTDKDTDVDEEVKEETEDDSDVDDESNEDSEDKDDDSENNEKSEDEDADDDSEDEDDEEVEEEEEEEITYEYHIELNYFYVPEQTHAVTLPESCDVIAGTTLTITFPQGVTGEGTVSLLDSKKNKIESWKVSDLISGEEKSATITIPEDISDKEKCTIVVEDATYNYKGIVFEYLSPEGKEYTFHKAPTMPGYKITTTNSSSGYVKNDDVVTIQVDSVNSDEVKVDVTVNGVALSGSEGTYQYAVKDLADMSNISWEIKVQDVWGNAPVSASGSDLQYLAPITANVSTDKDKAAYGDRLTLSWEANHDVRVSGQFLNQYFEETGEKSVSKSVQAEEDQSKVGYNIKFRDNANNELTLSENNIIVFAPLEIRHAEITPESGYVKDGSAVELNLSTNHSATYEGFLADIEISGSANPSLTHSVVVKDREDKSVINCSLVLVDEIGQTVPIQLNGPVYLAPVTAEVIESHTYSKTEGYVKNGDTLMCRIVPNHDIEVVSARYSGADAYVQGNTASISVGSSMSDGTVVFSALLRDAAGNELEVSHEMNVICDNTAPQLSLTPNVSLFSSDDVNLTVGAEDSNLDEITFTLNGEKTSDSCSGSSYSKIFTLKEDAEYEFVATAVDKAGNSATSETGKVILDKTDPEITRIVIDGGDTVYPAGISLSKFFTISEKYLQSVEATLEISNGNMRTVSLDDSLEDEGKQTASVSAVDMAGNKATAVTYTYYIDGTAPKVIANLNGSLAFMSTEKTNDVTEGDKVSLSLDDIWMGSEEADHFTSVKVKTADNKVEKLKKSDLSTLEIEIESGAEEIIVEAVDDVGNETGEIVYKLATSQKSSSNSEISLLTSEKDDNNGSKYFAVIVGSFVISAIVFFFIWMVLKKKNKLKTDD